MVTPLARRVINQVIAKPVERTMVDYGKLLNQMDDIHCFEVTEVVESANEIVKKGELEGLKMLGETMGFLPAPKTWIEWEVHTGSRCGFLLQETPDKNYAKVNLVVGSFIDLISLPDYFHLPLIENKNMVGRNIVTPPDMNPASVEDCMKVAIILMGVLAFINSPKIIGQKQHMPSQNLERKLLKNRKNIGVFPLHAWKEIILRITPPEDASNKESKEAHLTGNKALHWCRAHLRLQYGKLVVVRGHWRGDASLGIEQRKYRLTR